MPKNDRGVLAGVRAVCAVAMVLSGAAAGASDLATKNLQPKPPAPSSDWEFKFMPYAWMVFDTGNLKLGDTSGSVNTNIFQLLEKVDNVYAWMSYQELRKGPLAIYANVFWTKMSFSDTKSGVVPIGKFIDASVAVRGKMWIDLAIIEPGVTYEFSHSSSGVSSTSWDVLVGARYWYLKPDINLDVSGTISIPALGLSRTGAGNVSAAKVIDWLDPIIGLRMRHVFSPGNELLLQSDVGGFGVGSKFTWQALGTYGYETQLAGYKLRPFLGYRAISIDYEEGAGARTIGLNLVQHGPIIGMTFIW